MPAPKQQQPDPRLSQKNFAMPMNPSGIGAPEFLATRRKDGVPPPKRDPSPLAGTSVNGVSGSISGRRRESDSVPTLFGTLIRKSDGSRYVTISEGAVVEIIPKSASGSDSITEHAISNIWTAGLLTEHGPVASGGTVGVAFEVDENGNIDQSNPLKLVRIAVMEPGDDKSVHYTPPVGSDTTGAAGSVYVALYKLTGSGDTERLESLHGASAVYHIHDTPSIKAASGDADVFKKYDLEQGAYITRGISGGPGITVTERADDIEVKLGGGEIDINIIAYGRAVTWTDGYVSGLGTSTEEHWVIAIRGGVVVGHYDSLADMVTELGEEALSVASRHVLDDTVTGA